MIKDMVICNDEETISRTKKIDNAMNEICYEFDLSKPLWFRNTIEQFKRHDKTRFTKDNFIDDIYFDYLEIDVIEED